MLGFPQSVFGPDMGLIISLAVTVSLISLAAWLFMRKLIGKKQAVAIARQTDV